MLTVNFIPSDSEQPALQQRNLNAVQSLKMFKRNRPFVDNSFLSVASTLTFQWIYQTHNAQIEATMQILTHY
jgi:hypothetical protein